MPHLMKYADFIKGNEGFQYSVNLQYDLYNSMKVKGYIPTKKSVELLYEYLLNTRIKERSKSTVLIGPYGKGKSHLLLILLNILGAFNEGENKEVIEELILKIEKVDKECANLIRDIYGNNKYVPIIINSNSTDLNQSFLIALNQALSKIGADDILPTTYFDAAIDVIEGWKKYDLAFKNFKELVKHECNVSVEVFVKNLKRFNASTYEVFKVIFKEITAGVEFNPLINTDIVKLYEEVNHILNEKYGYSGLVVVFDEFSKFIEASAVYNTSRDLKIIQDFAELADRCNSPQIHFICVTHKTVNEYISKIPQEKIDAWRAVEGRFKEVYLNTSSEQNYELISNAIQKDEDKFNEFLNKHKDEYTKYNEDSYFLYNDLYSGEEFEREIIRGCFPLSAYSTFALPKISEKVAQNERTLFTFLSKQDKDSLLDVIKNNKGEKELVTIDNLYDYFEPLFKKEVFNEQIHSLWLKTDTALNYTQNENERCLIKALSIIYVINDFKTLAPTVENIRKAIGYSKDEINNIIASLKERNIIMLRSSNNTIDFMPISGIDVEGKISSLVEVKQKNIDISGVLDKIIHLKYVLPRKYNDEFKMVRYFNRIFMTQKEVVAYDSAQLLLDNKKGDGLLINLIYETEEEKEAIANWVRETADRRVGIIIPNKQVNIRSFIARYVVLNDLLNDSELLKEDPVIESQLIVLLEDTVSFIKNSVEELYDITKGSATLVIKDEVYKNMDDKKLSAVVSGICDEYFSKSPIVNNELINKDSISAPLLKARNQIVSKLLDGSYKQFDSNGNGVDCTLFRTTILNKGLLGDEENYNKDLIPLLYEIRTFILEAEKEEKNFNELYEHISTASKNISARKGIIPIYLAFVIKKYTNEVVIYIDGRNKKEVPLTTEVINNINDQPQKYCLKIEKGTKEKEDYLLELQQLFGSYLKAKLTGDKYADIVKAMQSWLQSLSKYSKVCEFNIANNEKIDKSLKTFRNALVKFDINNRQFIFKNLPQIFEVDQLDVCISKIKKAKEYLEARDNVLRSVAINKTIEIINKEYKGSVSSVVKVWLHQIDDEKLAHLYDTAINSTIELFKANENNDKLFIEKLAYILTGLSLEDWNDTSISTYCGELQRVKNTIESYEVALDKDSNEGLIKIAFVNNENESKEKTFNKVEISPVGSTLLSNLEEIFEEFGDSIDDNEKRNVLIKMLEKFI